MVFPLQKLHFFKTKSADPKTQILILENGKPPVKPFNNRLLFASVLTSLFTTFAHGQIQPDPIRYEASIESFENADLLSPQPNNAILLVGSSSIGFWNNDAPADLAPLNVIPRGFGGSVMNDVLHYYERVVLKYAPRAIVLYEGDNDLAWGLSPTTILNQLANLIANLDRDLPDTRLYLLDIKPSISRAHLWTLAQEVNNGFASIAEADPNVFHINVAAFLLDDNGNIRKDIYRPDGLHLNTAGYDIWAEVIRAALTLREAEFSNDSIGTNFYNQTNELVTDCAKLINDSQNRKYTLGFLLTPTGLQLSNFDSRSKNSNCNDTLEVIFNNDGTVQKATFTSNILYVYKREGPYLLNAEHDRSRLPTSQTGGAFVFDAIEAILIK
jgi:lysophospholipase L1-like esterase